mmetsp:Transcript_13669/g.47221  ORF Transcript_13669/g.47221 Transcript_13669/m.47221 type:complete len:286 (-) Transcript_13669:967-1824(-)
MEEEPEALGCDHERSLVGRLALVADLVGLRLALRQHGVAHRQAAEEVRGHARVRGLHPRAAVQALVPEVEAWLLRALVGACGLLQRDALLRRNGTLDLRDAAPVLDARDRALEELHGVLREGASLVGEHRVNDAELLVQVGRAREEGGVRLLVVHVAVAVQYQHLRHFHHLERHVQRDGDQVAEEDEGRYEVDGARQTGPVRVVFFSRVPRHEVPVVRHHLARPLAVHDRVHAAQGGEPSQHEDDYHVEAAVNHAALAGRLRRVHHHLGVVPGEHHHADDFFRVA